MTTNQNFKTLWTNTCMSVLFGRTSNSTYQLDLYQQRQRIANLVKNPIFFRLSMKMRMRNTLPFVKLIENSIHNRYQLQQNIKLTPIALRKRKIRRKTLRCKREMPNIYQIRNCKANKNRRKVLLQFIRKRWIHL